ncbi:MAG: flavin-containing monooxygenase [Nocardioidaceae bacterium]
MSTSHQIAAVDTVVIGAGQAGLAVSHLLGKAGRDHVVLDRGRVAESWRSQRWDSLRLLTPRWMSRLPDWRYTGAGQDGYMAGAELVRYLERYAATTAAPLELGREVMDVAARGDGYRVVTDDRSWQARHVVIATGPTGRPHIPDTASGLDPGVHLITPLQYRNPDQLPAGGVLVVGAAASGAQIADELARAGRRVVLAAGRHVRIPRRYRGMEIYWWLEQLGHMSRTIDTVADPDAARRQPSPQLTGREPDDPRGADLNLRTLEAAGVELTGRMRRFDGMQVTLADDLADTIRAAERRQARLLDGVDRYVEHHHLTREVDPPDRPAPIPSRGSRTQLDLRGEGIATVVLATGLRAHYPWLRVPVFNPDGTIRQVRGSTPAPGLYVVGGQRFQHRRDAATLDGARHEARDVAAHLCGDNGRTPCALEA